jgi:hypothetical protein
MPALGLAEHRADQAVEQVDGLVGQAGAEIQGGGDQCRLPTLPLIACNMLDRGAARLARELSQARLVDQVSAAGLDADRTDMLQALDHAEHGGRLGGLRHLPQPGQPTLAGLFPALRQRIQPMPLLGRGRSSDGAAPRGA